MSRDRKGCYLKPSTRATVPGVVFTIDVDTHNEGVTRDFRLTRRKWMSAKAAVVYRTRNGWTHPQTVRVGTPAALRQWMQETSLPNRINWVVVESVSETLTLSKWWHHAQIQGVAWRERPSGDAGASRVHPRSHPVRFDRLALALSCETVEYTHRGRRWRWVAAFNYGTALAGRDESLREADGTRDGSGDDGQEGRDRATRHGEPGRLARFIALCEWWRNRARCHFATTVGQLAVGMLRTLTPPRVLCSHNRGEVLRLERAASFGGRASVWYTGEVGEFPTVPCLLPTGDGPLQRVRVRGPVAMVDVRSMYPYLLAHERFPVKLHSTPTIDSPSRLFALCERNGVIARVTINTRVAEYPRRDAKGVTFPIGRFTTTLTGPELLRLREDGEVLKCHETALYLMSDALSAVASSLLEERSSATRAGDASSASFAKQLANSLAGKLAQRKGGWVRDPERDEPDRWGEGSEVSRRTGKVERFRWICGLCWRYEDDRDGRGPYTFAFAYLAAYGRLMMRTLRESLPARTAVSQDTDGVWLLPNGIEALERRGELDGAKPGSLQRKGPTGSGRFFGPRHYCVDGKWTLAGYCEPSPPDQDLMVWEKHRPAIWRTRSATAPDETWWIHSRKKLALDLAGGRVMPDGWVEPPHIIPRRDAA